MNNYSSEMKMLTIHPLTFPVLSPHLSTQGHYLHAQEMNRGFSWQLAEVGEFQGLGTA